MYLGIGENSTIVSLEIDDSKVSFGELPGEVRQCLCKLTVNIVRIRNVTCVVIKFFVLSINEFFHIKEFICNKWKSHLVYVAVNELEN